MRILRDSVRITAQRCSRGHIAIRRAGSCVSLIGLLGLAIWCPVPAFAQTDLPDLTHRLTPLHPRIPAPDFELKDLDGKTRKLSDYKGKVVLLNFWATWCPPCRREMPSMERLYQKFKQESFTILAPNQMESFDLVFAFTGQLDPAPTFPILLDEKNSVPKHYGVKGLPASYVIDKQGRVAFRAMGGREFDHPEIEKILRGLIRE